MSTAQAIVRQQPARAFFSHLSDSRIMTGLPELKDHGTTARPRRGSRALRNILAWLLGATTFLATALIVVAVIVNDETRKLVIAGLQGYDAALIALLIALLGLTSLLAMIPRKGRWLSSIPGVAIIPVGLTILLVSPTPLVALEIPNCTTPYVVDDTWGGGKIYRQEGFVLHQVASIVTDDGYRPFYEGGYEARMADGSVEVRHFQSRPGSDDTLDLAPVLMLSGEGTSCR